MQPQNAKAVACAQSASLRGDAAPYSDGRARRAALSTAAWYSFSVKSVWRRKRFRASRSFICWSKECSTLHQHFQQQIGQRILECTRQDGQVVTLLSHSG